MPPLPYTRPLIKISGEALMGSGRHGIDCDTLDAIATDIADVAKGGAPGPSSSAAETSSEAFQARPTAWTASRAISWGCWRRS